jgi:hypothetical protein
MTLLKIIEQSKRDSDKLDTNTIGRVLKRVKIDMSNITINEGHRDEIIYSLGKINRC